MPATRFPIQWPRRLFIESFLKRLLEPENSLVFTKRFVDTGVCVLVVTLTHQFAKRTD